MPNGCYFPMAPTVAYPPSSAVEKRGSQRERGSTFQTIFNHKVRRQNHSRLPLREKLTSRRRTRIGRLIILWACSVWRMLGGFMSLQTVYDTDALRMTFLTKSEATCGQTH